MAKKLSMDRALIKKLKKIIKVNLENESFGVLELATEIGLSRSQLHRRLKEITGKSSSQFIREFRLEKAMEMLKKNQFTASEIAYRVGFTTQTLFEYNFKKLKIRRTFICYEKEITFSCPPYCLPFNLFLYFFDLFNH